MVSNRSTCLLLSVALLGLFLRVSAQDWEPLGPNDWNWPSVGEASYPRLAVDDNNDPVILAKDHGEDGRYHVRRWNGAEWIALGSDGFFSDGALLSNMVLDEAGNPVLAGTDPSNEGRLMVRRWNGTSWVSVGAEGISPTYITSVSLAKDVSGRYVVAYGEGPWDRHIIVKRWNGSVWEIIGDENFSDPGAYYGVSLALDPSGNPVVAYHAYPGIHLTRVQHWTGAIWETLPPIDLGNYPVEGTGIAVDEGGYPIVTLTNWMLGRRPVVVRWNGSTWETLGPNGISVGICSDQHIAMDADGRPVIFYRDYTAGTFIRRWNGSEWEILCAIDVNLSLENSKMAMDGNGDFIVAGESGWLGGRSHVQRWNGSEWLEYGERGFSTMGAYYTSLAMDGAGEIVVAYGDASNGVRTTVQRWNGEAWEVIGTTGISAGHSAYHALELDTLGRPIVAYVDSVNAGLTVLRWNGLVWEPLGPAGFTSEHPVGLSMSLTSDGRPVVAYKVSIGIEDFYRIKVVSWDGASWNEVGQFPAYWAEGGMSLALDSSDNPVVGYDGWQYNGSRVVQWDGTEWNTLPDVVQAGWPHFQDLIVDAVDRPILASGGTLYRWEGTSWLVIGSEGDLSMSYVCLAISDNNEIIAGGLVGGRATVRRWKGEYWEGVGSQRFTTSFSSFQGPQWLGTDGHGRVVVAYTNGGMYAKSIEYSDVGIVIGAGVLNLGPNPNLGEELWISLGGLPTATESVEAELHDMSGQVISAQLLPVAHGELNTRFAVPPGLASGVYVATVFADGSRWSTRLIIAKP